MNDGFEQMASPITDDLVADLLSDAANLAVLMAGLPDAGIAYRDFADEVAGTLRDRGLGADVAARIAAEFVSCVKRVKAEIETASGSQSVRTH